MGKQLILLGGLAMTDDILSRLRNYDFMRDGDFPEVIMAEAADQIERLRTLLHRWENCEQVIDALCGWDSEKTFCEPCKELGAND
jgi:hypothetical protein